jgi:hypothetical protein
MLKLLSLCVLALVMLPLLAGGCKRATKPAPSSASADSVADTVAPLNVPPASEPLEGDGGSTLGDPQAQPPGEHGPVARRVDGKEQELDDLFFDVMLPLVGTPQHEPALLDCSGQFLSTQPVEGLGQLKIVLGQGGASGRDFEAVLESVTGTAESAPATLALRGRGMLWAGAVGHPPLLLLQLGPQEGDDPEPTHYFRGEIAYERSRPAKITGWVRLPTEPRYVQLTFTAEQGATTNPT